jgi:hypothetical protein
MNFNLIKRSFAATLLLSMLTSTGSALAYKPIPDLKPNPSKIARPISCTCQGRYVPPKLCPMIHCPDLKSSSVQTVPQVGETSKTGITQTEEIIAKRMCGGGCDPGLRFSDNLTTVLAGRYRTRAGGGGIA